MCSPPKPVFQPVSSKRHCSSHRHHQPEILTRAQQDLIKYVYESESSLVCTSYTTRRAQVSKEVGRKGT